VALLAVLAVLAGACADGGGGQGDGGKDGSGGGDGTTPTTAPAPPAGADAYGMNLGLNGRDLDRADQTTPLVAATGAGWARFGIAWARVQPQADGAFQWAAYDAIVDRLRADGREILATLAFTTQWNTTAPPEETRLDRREHYPPRDWDAWGRYVFETVSHYRGQVRTWEIWNEPDLRGFWSGTPAEYARLLAIAADNVRRADPDSVVVLGGLSLGGSPGSLDPDFFGDILADPTYPAAASFDVANIHHYGAVSEARRRMAYVQGELARFGVDDRPIWVTEAGYPSEATYQTLPGYQGPDAPARWLAELLPELFGLGAAKVFWFQLDDSVATDPAHRWGLYDLNLGPKPALPPFQALATSG